MVPRTHFHRSIWIAKKRVYPEFVATSRRGLLSKIGGELSVTLMAWGPAARAWKTLWVAHRISRPYCDGPLFETIERQENKGSCDKVGKVARIPITPCSISGLLTSPATESGKTPKKGLTRAGAGVYYSTNKIDLLD